MTQQTIKDSAINYKPKTAKNISELKAVSVNLILQEEIGRDQDGIEYSFHYILVENEKYRIPDTVLKDLKQILEKKPSLKTFSVSRSGEGRNTKYTVIPLD
jgi:hypothetical protein